MTGGRAPGVTATATPSAVQQASAQSISLAEAIRAAGMQPPDYIPPGVSRFPGIEKKSSNRAGWCWLSDDRRGAAYGDYPTGQRWTWQADRRPLSRVDWRAMQQTIQRRDREQRRQRQDAASECMSIHNSAAQAPRKYPYLIAKQIERYHSLFRYNGHAIIAPLETADGLVNLQYIYPDGRKRFHPKAQVKDAYFVAAVPDNHTQIIIAEGIVTGCTLATIEPTAIVIVAMNCGNLLPVAQTIRAGHPHDRIIIAGDNDRFTEDNPGKTAAIAAARAIGAQIAIPEFPPDVPGTDYNDLMCAGCL